MSDLIDRQKAIDVAMNDSMIINAMDSVQDGNMHRTKRSITRLLASLPSANQWIPCSERLPGYNIRVLVIDKNNSIDIAELVDYSDINEPDEWWSYEYKVHDPVAWMPLPEPWKGEK